MRPILATLIALGLAGPALAEGDAVKGEDNFKKCRACHSIETETGEVIVKGGKTGPNLYGVAGRTAGTYDDFKYGPDLVAAGEQGLVWNEEEFVAYVQDPTGFLKEHLDNSKAKSRMTLKLPKGGEDIFAYLVSVGPQN